MERVAIGLLGLGTVGGGVARLLHEARERVATRAGHPIALKRVLVRDPGKIRPSYVAPEQVTLDPGTILEDSEIRIVVEAMGGSEQPRRLVLEALAAGKDVVTANKALLAEHGTEIFDAARRRGRVVAFEASVGGGIPIIQAVRVGLAANQIQALSAIVNGTCNFILSAMSREGLSYQEALAEAQRLGYAEPDPTLDVDGTDTAHKLSILAQLAFGAIVPLSRIPRQGIDHLQLADIKYALELGYAIKLLAQARLTDEALELRVAPRLVRLGTPLADVQGPYNAIRVVGDAVGDTLFYGRGAGALPTASAIVADLIDVVVGRTALLARSRDLWLGDRASRPLAAPSQVKSRYYLRFLIADRPGVLAGIARVLGHHGISIASVIQHESSVENPTETTGEVPTTVPLVIMTHTAVEAALTAALTEIDRLDVVTPPSVCLGVEVS